MLSNEVHYTYTVSLTSLVWFSSAGELIRANIIRCMLLWWTGYSNGKSGHQCRTVTALTFQSEPSENCKREKRSHEVGLPCRISSRKVANAHGDIHRMKTIVVKNVYQNTLELTPVHWFSSTYLIQGHSGATGWEAG